MFENVGQVNFFHHFMISKTSTETCGKSRKSWPGEHFPRFGLPKRLEPWKMLARLTFPPFSSFIKFSPKLLESWQGLVFQESLIGTVSQSIISINFGG